MPRTVPPLSHTRIASAKPREKEYPLRDGQGLLVLVKPNGRKPWLLNYQKPFKRNRTHFTLGYFPELSLMEARAKRAQCRELLVQDIDPQEHFRQQYQLKSEAHQNTLQAVADRWFEVKQSSITEDYAMDVYNSLANHVFPKLGTKPLHLITAPDAIEVLQPVAQRGNLELVRRICQRLNQIMDFAVNTGVVAANPLSGIKKAFRPPKKQHLPTIRPEELPELLLAIERSNLEIETFQLVYWQLHTMLRPAEAAKAKWQEFDFDNQLWHIPDHRMKMKRPHTVPLTRQMLSILDTMRPISGHREFVFTGRNNPRRSRSSQSVNKAFGRMGYKGKLVSHGLRSIASTYLNELSTDERVVEKALSHVNGNETSRAYNRAEYLSQVRETLQIWSDFIDECKPPENDG